MKKLNVLQLAVDPSLILKAQGMVPDKWQQQYLFAKDQYIYLNCSRQSGKSTTTAALALHEALFKKKAMILLLSPTQRQSKEIYRKMLDGYNAIGRPVKANYETQLEMEFENGSRIVCLPGKEGTIRAYSGVSLLIIDEAARVPDDLYRTVRPMLAISNGRLIALSTPYGQRGFFFNEWNREGSGRKIRITWKDCPRITEDFIKQEQAAMGQSWVNQEYECIFTAMQGLVYPDFSKCEVTTYKVPTHALVGGIDWGWRNPFAAIWGHLDGDDILWIQHERYMRQTPLHEHVKALPKNVMWYADPAGPSEISEFLAAGHKIRKGTNEIKLGIAAITSRIETGRLKVNSLNCQNLITEASMYHYPDDGNKEKPEDEFNHALGALRYLVSRIDHRFIGKLRRSPTDDAPPVMAQRPPEPKKTSPIDQEHLWTRIS